MTEEQKLQIKALRKEGLTYQELADKFGISRSRIGQLITGKRYTFTIQKYNLINYHLPVFPKIIVSPLYHRIKVNGKPIMEHRYVMEQYLGRKLAIKEHIHHINGVKNDNSIENLLLVNDAEHKKIHQYNRQLYKYLVSYYKGENYYVAQFSRHTLPIA